MEETLQREGAELTDDEMSILLFTSVDHDWLPNLIMLPGECRKWFNTEAQG